MSFSEAEKGVAIFAETRGQHLTLVSGKSAWINRKKRLFFELTVESSLAATTTYVLL